MPRVRYWDGNAWTTYVQDVAPNSAKAGPNYVASVLVGIVLGPLGLAAAVVAAPAILDAQS